MLKPMARLFPLKRCARRTRGSGAARANDNKETMGGGFEESFSHPWRAQAGDRVRVSFWLRPPPDARFDGMGRTSFEQIWRPFDTDWMQVVCDFRARADGTHSIWITQQGAANDFLLDDFARSASPRLALGYLMSQRVAISSDPPAGVWLLAARQARQRHREPGHTGETVAPSENASRSFSLSVIDKERQNAETIVFRPSHAAAVRRGARMKPATLARCARPPHSGHPSGDALRTSGDRLLRRG